MRNRLTHIDGGSIVVILGWWKLPALAEKYLQYLLGKKEGKNTVQRNVFTSIVWFLSGIRALRVFIFPPHQSLRRVSTILPPLNLSQDKNLYGQYEKDKELHHKLNLNQVKQPTKKTQNGGATQLATSVLTPGYRGNTGKPICAKTEYLRYLAFTVKVFQEDTSGRLNLKRGTIVTGLSILDYAKAAI